MDDIKLALLGNQEAAKRLTDAGVLLPCPGCRGEDTKHRAVMACVMLLLPTQEIPTKGSPRMVKEALKDECD